MPIMNADITGWTTRITLKRTIKDEINQMAQDEMRSTATMIGLLLQEAVSARCSTASS